MAYPQNQREITKLGFGPVSCGGFFLVLAGWALVLYDPVIFPIVARTMPGGGLPQPNFFVPIIGQNAIITGIGIVLVASAGKALRLLLGLHTSRTRPAAPAYSGSNMVDGAPGKTKQSNSQSPRNIPVTQKRASSTPNRDIITRGALNGRGYVLFRDGSVVVETLLGPKRFSSMTDAQRFVAAS